MTVRTAIVVVSLALAMLLGGAPSAQAGELLALERGEDGALQLRSRLAEVDRTDPEEVACAAVQALLDLEEIERAVGVEAERDALLTLAPMLTDDCMRRSERILADQAAEESPAPTAAVARIDRGGTDGARAVVSGRSYRNDGAEEREWLVVSLARREGGLWTVSIVASACSDCFGSGACKACSGTGWGTAEECSECRGDKVCGYCNGLGTDGCDHLDPLPYWEERRRDLAALLRGEEPPPPVARLAARETIHELLRSTRRAFDQASARALDAALPGAHEAVNTLFGAERLAASDPDDDVMEEMPEEEWERARRYTWTSIESLSGDGEDRVEARLVHETGRWRHRVSLIRGGDGLYRLDSISGACDCAGQIEACARCGGSGELPASPTIF